MALYILAASSSRRKHFNIYPSHVSVHAQSIAGLGRRYWNGISLPHRLETVSRSQSQPAWWKGHIIRTLEQLLFQLIHSFQLNPKRISCKLKCMSIGCDTIRNVWFWRKILKVIICGLCYTTFWISKFPNTISGFGKFNLQSPQSYPLSERKAD